jgi:hypothetical protein
MYPLNREPQCAEYFPRKDDTLSKTFLLIRQEVNVSLREERTSDSLDEQ